MFFYKSTYRLFCYDRYLYYVCLLNFFKNFKFNICTFKFFKQILSMSRYEVALMMNEKRCTNSFKSYVDLDVDEQVTFLVVAD